MRLGYLAASAFLAAVWGAPNQAVACCGCGCRCMMPSAPAPGGMRGMPGMPGMAMNPMGGTNGNGGAMPPHGRAVPAPFSEPPAKAAEIVVSVSGMMSPTHCPQQVRKALTALPGVKQVHVDFDHKLAVVTAEPAKFDEKAVSKALEQAGYAGRVLK